MNLESMSKDDLINALMEQGVELTGNERIDTLRKMLGERSDAPKSRRANAPAASKLSGKKAIVNVHKTEYSGPAITVGINGNIYRIKTGVDVEVPVEVVGVLKDAVQRTFPVNPQTKQREAVETLAYPFSSRAA